ncbi:WD repeat-containing protein 36-like [Anneissia japonica]|uniref:WD repeat-containing protein 36-like n=1 Tax=Anneissia japonica TaxID=1529436 RepID=UPI0014257B4F|nr:WD repeat-containing protein 36-like [Anneissia japonica]
MCASSRRELYLPCFEMAPGSKIFVGSRAIGFYSNHVPLLTKYNQKFKETYVITSVGKSFHTYNCSNFGLISVSDAHPSDITCMAADSKYVYTAYGNTVTAFIRSTTAEHVYECPGKNVHHLLPFGDHLIAVDVESHVSIWHISTKDLYMELEFNNSTFRISTMMHPSTYLNKILFGSHQGTLQLWNIRKNKLVYTFDGWNSHVTAIEQAPAVDVVAIGLANGNIIIHNLRFDESVMTFTQDWGLVTAISFRTDGHPIMATGSMVGHIAFWDLEEKKLKGQMRDVHHGAVTGMCFLNSEPLMVTTAADNALKMWIFDQPDCGGRLHKIRSGHYAPPTRIRFHGKHGKDILSAGQDCTLKSFSTVHEKHNKNFGQASMNRSLAKKKGLKNDVFKLPPIVDFAAECSREMHWDGIVACHHGSPVVSTWNFQKSCMGSHKLMHKRFDNMLDTHVEALVVEITTCGNFALVGWSTGHVDLYNIQSGIFRGSFGNPTAHNGPIRGAAVDGLNQVAITGASDGYIKFWQFKSKELLKNLKMESAVSMLFLHRESSMMAVALDNFTVNVVDIDTHNIVRVFSGHRNSVTDMAFRSDGRWLLTSSMDSTIRTWDLPLGRLVDSFLLDSPATSLTLSPTGDHLATTHVDDLGVYLWNNRTLYVHVALKALPDDFEPAVVALPGTYCTTNENEEDEANVRNYEDELEDIYKSPEQISSELVTLSLLPESRWKSLTNLELIRKRNKPTEPPKLSKVPFFLPTIPGLELKFAATKSEDNSEASRILQIDALTETSELCKCLSAATASGDYHNVMVYMKELGPSAIDKQIRSLSPIGGGSFYIMTSFIRFLESTMLGKRDYELGQAYIGLFLKVHGDLLAREKEFIKELESLQKIQLDSWKELNRKFNQSSCIVNYLKNATL